MLELGPGVSGPSRNTNAAKLSNKRNNDTKKSRMNATQKRKAAGDMRRWNRRKVPLDKKLARKGCQQHGEEY